MKRFIFRTLIFLVFLVISGELFFRTVIPASTQPLIVQDPENKIMKFDPDPCSDGIYTSGNFGAIRVPWHVNNYGFIADIDYKTASEKDKPRIVVIGDSFITGFIIPWEKHVAHVLEEKLEKKYDVYSIGATGGMLIHYSKVAQYAAEEFDPDIFIFVLNDTDIESSIYNFNQTAPFNLNLWYENGEFQEKTYSFFQVNKIKRLMRNSAIISYIWRNKNYSYSNADNLIVSVRDSTKAPIVQAAADYCIQKIISEHPDKTMLFVMDSDRRWMYEHQAKPDIVPESKYLKNAIAEFGGYHLDLTDTFYEDYQNNHIQLDWDHDYHWTPRTHGLVAEFISQFLIENKLVPQDIIVSYSE